MEEGYTIMTSPRETNKIGKPPKRQRVIKKKKRVDGVGSMWLCG
jgi:hypothetical protein